MSNPRVIRKLYTISELQDVLAEDTLCQREMYDEALHCAEGEPHEIHLMTIFKNGQIDSVRVEVVLPANTGGTGNNQGT